MEKLGSRRAKEFGLYSSNDGAALKEFKQGTDRICFALNRIILVDLSKAETV